MKVCSYWLLILAFAVMTPVQADESGERVWVAGVGSDGLMLRRNLSDDGALLLGVYYSGSDFSADVGTGKSLYLRIEAGYRKYMDNDDLRSFLDTSVMYAHPSSSTTGNVYSGEDPVYTGLIVAYGLEKHLSEAFSIEGSIGVRVTHIEDSSSKQTAVSAPISHVAVNYYF